MDEYDRRIAMVEIEQQFYYLRASISSLNEKLKHYHLDDDTTDFAIRNLNSHSSFLENYYEEIIKGE